MSLQLDLFAEPPPPPVAPVAIEPDGLAERIIAAGLAHNGYLLTLNRGINIAAMNLPSRMMQWPLEFMDRTRRADRESALLLRHPDFEGFPFVDQVEAAIGVRPRWEPEDEFGRDRAASHRYFHAIDLLTDEHWPDLLATANFTDRNAIVSGLKFHAEYGGLNIANARSVLAEIGEEELADRSAAYLESAQCSVTTAQQGQFPGFAHDSGNAQSIWAAIHGLEDKKFRREKSGWLRFSPSFLKEKLEAAA